MINPDIFLLILGGGLIISCGTVAAKFHQKRTYFREQLHQITDEEERSAIAWYRHHLGTQVNAQLIGVTFICGFLFIFRQQVGSLLEVPGNIGYYALSIIVGVASWIIWKIRKTKQPNLITNLENDRRPPVLYLRSFHVDGDAPFIGTELANQNAKKILTYEDMAIGYAKMVGPVIAIASPMKNAKEDFGASKGRFPDWEKAVLDFMEKASLIIMRPYNSAGVLWEFEQIVKMGYLQKTLLYVNFEVKETKQHQQAYIDFRNAVLLKFGLELGEAENKVNYFNEKNQVWETDDYFDIPVFRKVFYHQYILEKKLKPIA